MYPSTILREKLEKKLNIDLEKFKWSNELENQIMNIKLDPYLEDYTSSFKEVYQNGYNIGHCGLTSRYLTINLPNAKMYKGTCDILQGTFHSTYGDHAWVVYNNLIIDPTLMIAFPVALASTFGYKGEALADSSARILSEYDLYSHEFINQRREENYLENRLSLTYHQKVLKK